MTVPLDYSDPGGQTLDRPPQFREAMKDAGRRYDLIGMAPRFVGPSTPLDCGWPTGTWIRSAGESRAAFDRVVTLQRSLAERCRQRHADVLPFVTTRNTARDMDVIRAALGERRRCQ